MITAIDKEAWGYATVLGAAFVALNVVYLPRRFIPMKYLLPGLLFLAVFGIYPVLYTAYSSLTNYGTGHVISRSQAIAQIQSQSVGAVEGATRYDVTPLKGPDGTFAGFGLYDPASGQLFLGTDTELTELDASTAQLQTLTTTGRTFVESVGDYTGVRPGQVRSLPGYPDPATYQMPGETEGAAITISGGQASESTTTRHVRPGRQHDHRRRHRRRVPRGHRLLRGRRRDAAEPRLPHQHRVRQLPRSVHRLRVPERFRYGCSPGRSRSRCCRWCTCFALGLLLAVVFDDEHMRGRKLYRSLIIIPYALPGFMTALVWRGMLNETYGINRWLPIDVPWLSTTVAPCTTWSAVRTWPVRFTITPLPIDVEPSAPLAWMNPSDGRIVR